MTMERGKQSYCKTQKYQTICLNVSRINIDNIQMNDRINSRPEKHVKNEEYDPYLHRKVDHPIS